MVLTVGEPGWTDPHFSRSAAQDDLGIEALGGSLLRELVPGVVQNSINAGYYAYYPFLLQEFEREHPDENRRSEFRPFYRRQEAAFAAACSHHEHRDGLRGLNGVNESWDAFNAAQGTGALDVAQLAAPKGYMKSSLGGYGLFYRPALEEIGVTRLGAGTAQVDRVTELGAQVAEAFRELISTTEYWQRYRTADVVPIPVLEELGSAVCPCSIPGRVDHLPIVEVLFGERSGSERWEQSRKYRVMSFGLLLEFQQLRPDGFAGVGAWRRAVLSGELAGKEWETSFSRHREAWRAYQYRETLVVALGAVWCCFLERLGRYPAAYREDIQAELINELDWSELGLAPDDPYSALIESSSDALDDPNDLIESAEAVMLISDDNLSAAFTESIRLLAALAKTPSGDSDFEALLGRGGSGRLSFQHMSRWSQSRSHLPAVSVVAELVNMLVFRHQRVAVGKITPTDHRDPFCTAEDDDGRLQLIRGDEPFWTGARFDTLNHLLWTAGALDSPGDDARPTELGLELLASVSDQDG